MRKLASTKTWIFDLDNTLYPPECDLFSQIDLRMGAFISDFLSVDKTEARRVQKKYFVDHGTTLNGLMTNHGLDPAVFLDFVHDIDHSPVMPDEDLSDALSELPGRKIIFTNGTVEHAEKVLERLGIVSHFSAIYDIVATEFQPKPFATAYEKIIDKDGVVPKEATMFEDISRNLKIPSDLGMNTVLVQAKGDHPDEDLGLVGSGEEPHIHFVTDDLSSFLVSIIRLADAN